MSSEKRITSTQIIHRLSIYKDLVDSLPAAVYICDPYGYILAYNEAAVTLWGRRPEIGKDLWCGSWKIYDLDGSPISLDTCPMAETLKTGEAVKGREIIIEQPEGSRFNVLPYPTPLRDDNGVMIGAINMLVDVSHLSRYKKLEQRTEELKRTTEELKRSEEKYHLMIEEVEDYAILLLSEDGIIQNLNRGAEKIKRYTEQEAVGKSFRIFYPEEDQKAGLPEKLLNIAYTQGKSNHEGWRVRKDGTRFWGSVSMTAVHDPAGKVIGYSKVTRDLTERRKRDLSIQQFNEDLKAKNEMLRLSEERYHRMVADVEDYAIILLDSHGYIQNWNKGAQTIKGYSAEEIVGKHFSIFYSEED
ncbi:MAG: PAS domain S-box protein, partial [Bacteroidota bacterium]|nr:PAS domain S-box protein [Bacteroidota bacterium]